MRTLCVFCGSREGARPAYAQAAWQLGELLAKHNITLVYGGARVGLMGLVADSTLSAGGKVIGVLPAFMANKELSHVGLTELVVVQSMHERKAKMAERSDGFIALPGGFGTFEELNEMVTWTQLGLQEKPCGIYNVEGYYDPLCAQYDRAVADGFLRPEHREIAVVDDDLERLLTRLIAWRPIPVKKWLKPSQT